MVAKLSQLTSLPVLCEDKVCRGESCCFPGLLLAGPLFPRRMPRCPRDPVPARTGFSLASQPEVSRFRPQVRALLHEGPSLPGAHSSLQSPLRFVSMDLRSYHTRGWLAFWSQWKEGCGFSREPDG